MKNISKRIICSILCVLLTFTSLNAVAYAGYTSDYPQGVTAEEALTAVKGTDTLLNNLVPALTGNTLAGTIKPILFNDETLSVFVTSLYVGLSQNISEMEAIGIDVSVNAVASALSDYPEVQKVLLQAGSWENVSLEGVKWGVNNKEGFATAFAKALTPFNDIFYMLLCSGSYTIAGIITVDGANGYENAIVPMLNSLKCTNLISQAEFTAAADKNKSNMLKNILLPLLTMVEGALASPMSTLTDVLPSFAYFIESGEMDACMDALLDPIFSNPLVELAVFFKILDLDSMSVDVKGMLSTGIADMSAESGFQMAEIDFKRLSECGSHNGMEFVSDKGRALVEILRWVIDTLKLNKNSLPQLMQGMGAGQQMPTDMLGGILDSDTDSLVGTIILLFTPARLSAPQLMLYPEIAQTVVQYTPNLTIENYQKVLNEVDDLLDDFVKEGGSYKSIEALLSSGIYSNTNINELLTGVYGALEKEGLTDILTMLGIDVTPKGVAEYIKNDYTSAYNVLSNASSWSKVKLNNVSWGFYNGSRRGFQNALVAVLRPLEPLLKVMLAGQDMVVMDSITLKGADGYNTAIIPILEALGCKESSIKTYAQYTNDKSKDALLDNVAEPIFDLLDEIFDNPVKTLTRILPNVVYFINSGSLEVCLSNLLIPVTALTARMEGVVDMGLDVSALTKELDLNNLLGGLLESSGMKIAEFDVNSLAGIGTKTEKQSKMVVNGNAVKYYYVEADQTGVLMTLLRVLAKTLKMPGNENLLTGMMAGDNSTFATYSSSIGEQFAQMTEDELIEWLYNLLFKERVKIEIVVDEDYNPTIIYKEPQKNYTVLYALGGFALVSAVIGIILFCNRKRLYY